MGKYTTIQIKKELYSELKTYCSDNGCTKSGLIEQKKKKKIGQPKLTNVLRVSD